MSPDATPIPDELVSAARSGDPAATARLWDLCAPVVRAVLRRHVGGLGAADAADLAQEAAVLILELLRSEPAAAPAEPFADRFGRKLYWRIHDYVRRERRRLGRQVAASEEELEAALRRRAGGAPAALPGRAIARALERLPPRQRAVISGLYFEDRSTRAVASELGISYRTVESLRRKAFAALRAMLTEEAVGPRGGGPSGGDETGSGRMNPCRTPSTESPTPAPVSGDAGGEEGPPPPCAALPEARPGAGGFSGGAATGPGDRRGPAPA